MNEQIGDPKKNGMNSGDSRERMERRDHQQQGTLSSFLPSCRMMMTAVVVVVVLMYCIADATASLWTTHGGSVTVDDSSLKTVMLLQNSTSRTPSFPLMLPQQQPQKDDVQQRHRRLTEESSSQQQPIRVLYIVTTLAEYNTGHRSTVKSSDRFQETLIPVVTESVESMIRNGAYQVDVFLVCHFTMRPERLALLRQALPPTVGLDYWDSATPLGYDTGGEKAFTKIKNKTEHLARQHRFVIKDLLHKYDHFACFEDDMVIKGVHISHFRKMTAELLKLRNEAPDELEEHEQQQANHGDPTMNFHGRMTKAMLQRTIPGFIRVEVLLNEEQDGAQRDTGPVPIDLDFGDSNHNEQQVNPEYCCHVQPKTANEHIPESPQSSKLMLWETNIMPLGIRQMPHPKSSSASHNNGDDDDQKWLDWVALLRGPSQNKLSKNATIGDYWSNRHGDYYTDMQHHRQRPVPMAFRYINNQGGWMATREQLWEWHVDICPGGFLPPYEAPHYRFDGLDMRNVEWYSGGMQLSTVRHACNMQRIIMMDPENFSKSLIYHSANNKQRQLAKENKREWFVKANTLLGQLNTIKKRALEDMKDEKQQQ